MAMDRLRLVAFQAIGQMAIILAMPFLTRIYEPVELGWYQLAFTIGVLIQPLVTLRAEFVIPSEVDDDVVSRSISLAVVCCSLMILSIGSFSLVCFNAGRYDWGMTAIMVAIISLSYSVSLLENAVMVRDSNTGRLAIRNLLTGSFTGALQVVLALIFHNVLWLAIAIMLGRFAAISLTRGSIVSYVSFRSLRSGGLVSWRMVTGVCSGFVASLGSNGILLLIQQTMGAAAVGLYGVANRAAHAPIGLISQALTQSVQASIGGAVRSGDRNLLGHVNQQMKSMIPYAAVACLGLTIGGPIIAEPFFGDGWGVSGQIIAVLGVPAGIQLLVVPVMPVYYMIASERQLLQAQVFRVILSFLGGFLGYMIFGGIIEVVAGYAIGNSMGYAVSYLVLRQLLLAGRASPAGERKGLK